MKRGKDKSYALSPISEDDIYFNQKMVERIKKSVEQARDAKYIEISSSAEIKELLGLLVTS